MGIPAEAGNDELSDYIAASFDAYKTAFNTQPFFGIRADRRLSFAQVRHVTHLLQKQGINRFSLLTEYH